MTVHNRRLKLIEFDIGGTQHECQITNWVLTPPQADGEKVRTFCPDGEAVDEVDEDWTLEIAFLADWRAAGISHYLQTNAGTDAVFTLVHHPTTVGEAVQWVGTVRLKAPPVGGERGAREIQTVTMPCIGKPTYTRV